MPRTLRRCWLSLSGAGFPIRRSSLCQGSISCAAKTALETAAALESQPEAKAALNAGELSFAQAPPEFGVPFKNVLDAETDRLWLKAHQDAKRDDGAAGGGSAAEKELSRAALAAQAFAGMIENGGGKGKTTRADLAIVCDLRAWRRGHAHEGEPCHIVGGGPIPVSLAKELGRDAFLKAVLHTGTEVHTIAHFGRRYSAVLRTALDLGAAPEFNGNVCAAPGCDRRYHLQRDHIDPVANGGLTTYLNNQPLCPADHRLKTERDRKAASSTARNLGPQTRHRPPDPQRLASPIAGDFPD